MAQSQSLVWELVHIQVSCINLPWFIMLFKEKELTSPGSWDSIVSSSSGALVLYTFLRIFFRKSLFNGFFDGCIASLLKLSTRS